MQHNWLICTCKSNRASNKNDATTIHHVRISKLTDSHCGGNIHVDWTIPIFDWEESSFDPWEIPAQWMNPNQFPSVSSFKIKSASNCAKSISNACKQCPGSLEDLYQSPWHENSVLTIVLRWPNQALTKSLWQLIVGLHSSYHSRTQFFVDEILHWFSKFRIRIVAGDIPYENWLCFSE